MKYIYKYMNNYNKWFYIMIWENYDIQFLFIKKYILIIINYIMKYITKSEISLHFKFIIIIIVRKIIFQNSELNLNVDIIKLIFLKIYNKLNNFWEINVSENHFSSLQIFKSLYKYKFHQYSHELFVQIYVISWSISIF